MAAATTRRELLARLAGGVAAVAVLPAPSVIASAPEDGTDLPRLDPSDPSAVALAYVHDAAEVDAARFRNYQAGQTCANCTQVQGASDAEWRPCLLIPRRLVNANGWCAAYMSRT